MDLEEVWRIREEEVYLALFGQVIHGIFPLQMEMFTEQFGQTNIDPRWLNYGVFVRLKVAGFHPVNDPHRRSLA